MTNWTDRPQTPGAPAASGTRNEKIENDLGMAKDRLRDEADEATRLAQKGAAAVRHKAAQLAEGAKAELEDRGEDAKNRRPLTTISRAASDCVMKRSQRASDLDMRSRCS